MTRLAPFAAFASLVFCFLSFAKGVTECEPPPKKEGAVYYKLIGDSGNPPLVLIPGNSGDMSSFDMVLPELTKHYQVLLLDQPGHGDSDENPKDDYSADAMATALHGVLKKLNLGKVTLLGHSLGGRTAMAYLDQFPDDVQGLVLEDMESCPREKSAADKEDAGPKLAKLKTALGKDFPTYETLANEVHRNIPFAEKAYGDTWIQEHSCLNKETGKWHLTAKPWVYERYRLQTTFQDFTPVLARRSRVPQLVMVSGESAKKASVHLPCLDEMKKANPKLQVKNISGSSHVIHDTRPADFLGALNVFTGVERPARGSASDGSETGNGQHSSSNDDLLTRAVSSYN